MLTNTRFTIGEMSKMHRIPESTLRYYDEKGIFHPSIVDPQTQYRYYTIDQFSTLDQIKFLRHLNISLKDIKRYMDKRTPAYALELLVQQKELMIRKQKEIEYMLQKINNGIEIIEEGMDTPKEMIIYKHLPRRTIAAIGIVPNATDEMFELSIHTLQNSVLQDGRLSEIMLYTGAIGVTVAKEALIRGQFQAYSSVFLHMNDVDDVNYDADYFKSIAEGLFVCMNHHGPYELTEHTYKLLLQEIDETGYEIIGDAIELCIIDFSMTRDPEAYITEIQIPVCRINN